MSKDFAPWLVPPNILPQGIIEPKTQSICFRSISFNLDTSLSIWALTDDYDHSGIAAMASSLLPHTSRYGQFFREVVPARFQISRNDQSEGGNLRVLNLTLLVRTGTARPTLHLDLLKEVLEYEARKLENSLVLENGARKLGNRVTTTVRLQVLDASNMTLKDQVAHFSQTHLLVANHGAGLSNMVFMPEGAGVLELRDVVVGDYFRPLAAIMRLQYGQVDTSQLPGSTSGLECAVSGLLRKVASKLFS